MNHGTNPADHAHRAPFEPREEDVQKRAYFLWQQEGRPVGRDAEFWHAAKEYLRHRHGSATHPAVRGVHAAKATA